MPLRRRRIVSSLFVEGGAVVEEEVEDRVAPVVGGWVVWTLSGELMFRARVGLVVEL